MMEFTAAQREHSTRGSRSEQVSPSISFDHVTKQFPLGTRREFLRSAVPSSRASSSGTIAIRDASLQVASGEIVGVIGRNGAGKSTLLRLGAAVIEPTSGSIRVAGLAVPMIELGFSFHPDLTGHENLPIAAELLGISRQRLKSSQKEIVRFSGVGPFMDQPIKHFSTGMRARLGFALAAHAPGNLYLIDEVLAVGDQAFQRSCIARIHQLADEGAGILFVSHSFELVSQVCDRVISIEDGAVVDDGPVDEVLARHINRHTRTASPVDGFGARILGLELQSSTIRSGESLRARCIVQVDDPGVELHLRSEIAALAQASAGSVNHDTMVAGALGRAGRWELEAEVGPIATTAGRLQLTVLLQLGRAPAGGRVIDQASTPFEVTGEQAGAIRLTTGVRWSASTDRQRDDEPRPLTGVEDGRVIWCDGLSKEFLDHSPTLHRLQPSRGAATQHTLPSVTALSGVTFSIGAGQVVGLIGANGAGKSTLLRVLAGVSAATSGSFGYHGSIIAVLDLGAGFHGDLTGRENAAFTWRLYGGSTGDLPRALEVIGERAGIRESMDTHVKHYSTGMIARLAISIALELQPEILLLDEVVSVGDMEFRQEVRSRIRDLVKTGSTVIVASHDLRLISAMCSRVLRLDAGLLVDDGEPSSVIERVGGLGWSGARGDVGGDVLLSELSITPNPIEWNQAFDVSVRVDTLRPVQHHHLEFALRNPLPDHERARTRSVAETVDLTAFMQRIELDPDPLTSIGAVIATGRVDGLPLLNWIDVVVSVVDDLDGTVLCEVWRPVHFGAEGQSSTRLDVRWTGRIADPGIDQV